ncbi:MAG: hypothetical protein JWQ73_1721 [Variovorax sp.]|nr:hypothetical protein [Variovorax sp.]
MKPLPALLSALGALVVASAALSASAAELELEGPRLRVSGMLDGSATKAFIEQLDTGKVRVVIFEDSFGGTAEAAEIYAKAIRASGVNTEARGQCYAACAYAFLAGKEHRFGRGLQVNGLLIPVAMRPTPGDLQSRWRGDEAQKTLAEFTTATASMTAAAASSLPVSSSDASSAALSVPTAVASASPPAPKENWQPDHGVLFSSTPTLFGRVYNTYYCDGSQGRDVSKCEALSDADPFKLGVLTP